MFCRSEFPYFNNTTGKLPVYLDSAATALKPYSVVFAVDDYMGKYTANVHRMNGVGNEATVRYEAARANVARFINAASPDNIIFTSGTTHSINMIADSRFARGTVIITDAEHNANIIPWLLRDKHINQELQVFETEQDGSFDLVKFGQFLMAYPNSLVSITQVSNVTGEVYPIKEIVKIAHLYGSKVLVDGAQAITHMPIDIIDLDADFYAFSAHKLYGPTGTGILYGKPEHLAVMKPQFGGGGMVVGDVTCDSFRLADVPNRFEAGTPNIAGAIGLSAAIDWIDTHGIQTINKHIGDVHNYAHAALEKIEGIRIIGSGNGSIISFVSDTANVTDIGLMLDAKGITCRTGKLCASPYLRKFNTNEVVRISFGPYSNVRDVDAFIAALNETLQTLK